MIKGNTNGIKEYMLNELEEIHDIKTEKGSLANIDIINKIVAPLPNSRCGATALAPIAHPSSLMLNIIV